LKLLYFAEQALLSRELHLKLMKDLAVNLSTPLKFGNPFDERGTLPS
jgi:hypothetical protein